MDVQKKYPSYIKTKLAWVPEIPAGWHVRKLTHAIGYTVGFTPESGNSIYYGDDFSWANISDLGPKVLNETGKGITLEAVAKYRKRPAHAGSLLYSFKLSVGQVSFAGKEMFTNEAIASFSESEWVHLPYFYYLAPLAIIQNASENIYGAKILNQEAIGNAKLIIPPRDEQQAISRFLDFKTAQIDALIAKKKVLLDKLAEKRTALISHIVTKGLDPSVAMKDSGLVWLGDVPAHWKVIPIKFSLDMPITDGPHSTPQFYDEGIPFISAEAVKNDRLDFSRKRGYISEDDHAIFSKKYKPKYGDVYMVKSGATTGAVARVETHEEFNIWSPLAVLRPHAEKSITDFLFYVLKSKPFFYSVELSWSYGTQQNIGMGVISNIRMALPPIEEQKEICRYLEPLLQEIEDQRAKVDSVVERLQEYRSALITNAVTGKIDVRDFQIPQPAEVQETA